MLRTAELEYELPERAIALRPAEPRDSARLMVVSRASGAVEHRRVRDLPEYLRAGDLLVLNTTRVDAARLVGVRADTGGRVEGLRLRGAGPGRWIALLQGKRLRPGVSVELRLSDSAGTAEVPMTLRLVEPVPGEPGTWVVESDDAAESAGRTPLPPYILRARRHAGVELPDEFDRERYQTVFARGAGGSVAAPTAGLHFTPELLARLAERGVGRADVTLDVGMGTFKPVQTEFVEDHPIHAEWCEMDATARDAILRTRSGGGRVVCVGTTAARVVETFAAAPGGERRETRLLITPGYRWHWTDALLTNFHLPRSTLMAMVAALLPGGAEQLRALYAEALREGYRFYSYGDAMLVV